MPETAPKKQKTDFTPIFTEKDGYVNQVFVSDSTDYSNWLKRPWQPWMSGMNAASVEDHGTLSAILQAQ